MNQQMKQTFERDSHLLFISKWKNIIGLLWPLENFNYHFIKHTLQLIYMNEHLEENVERNPRTLARHLKPNFVIDNQIVQKSRQVWST